MSAPLPKFITNYLLVSSGLLLIALFAAPRSAVQSAQATPQSLPEAKLSAGSQLRVGESITRTLTDSENPDHYAVFGAYGDLISVGMFATQDSPLAPSLEIRAPDGSQVAAANGKSEAVISALRLPSTGAYIIYAKSARATLGSYTLAVSAGWTLRDLDGSPLKMEAAYSGSLPRSADRQVWRLELRAGTVFSVLAQPAAESLLDPVIEVVTPTGDQLATAHDFSALHSAATQEIRAPVSGTYLIRISAYANKSIGAYDLIVRAPAATPTLTINATVEPVNQHIEAHVDQGTQYSEIIRGIPGQNVSVEVHAKQPEHFDPMIEVYGPSGRQVAEADDVSASNVDAVLKVTLDDGIGIYTIKVYGYALMPGDFTLIVRSP